MRGTQSTHTVRDRLERWREFWDWRLSPRRHHRFRSWQEPDRIPEIPTGAVPRNFPQKRNPSERAGTAERPQRNRYGRGRYPRFAEKDRREARKELNRPEKDTTSGL